jgi:hypothetical protein
MPDVVGRYTLGEMRERVRRCVDGLRPVVSVIDMPGGPGIVIPAGTETANVPIDPLFSNDDINFFLNSALTLVFVDMISANEEVFADEETVDIVANVMEYSLPTDLVQVRSLWWKDPSIAYTIVPATAWTFMWKRDEGRSLPMEMYTGVPTYRLNLNQFVLNEPDLVVSDNPQGVLVRYIKKNNFLSNDGDKIETQFAWVVQEVVIRLAAVELIEKRTKLDAAALRTDLTEWVSRLTVMVRNSTNPPFINMVPTFPRIRRQRSILR